MKKLILLAIIALSYVQAYAQNELEIKDLMTPASPGFQIIDQSPSNIDRPTNPKEFALNIFNMTSGGTVIPKNFAIEVGPYWYFKSKNASVYKYLNIKTDKTTNAFSGIFRKLSISISSSFNDSISGRLLANTNYIGAGARTNLLTLRSKGQHQTLSKAVETINSSVQEFQTHQNEKVKLLQDWAVYNHQKMTAQNPDSVKLYEALINKTVEKIAALDEGSNAELRKFMDSDTTVQKAFKDLTVIPSFQLDLAGAYSLAMPDNTWSKKRFNRSGVWINAAYTFNDMTAKKSKHLSFIGTGRYMNDNILTDTAKFTFASQYSLDYGLKIEGAIDKLTLSVEAIQRNFKDKDLNTHRVVGMIQYKVKENVYLTGTYGKNFGEINNVFTLLGINWGFGSESLSSKDN